MGNSIEHRILIPILKTLSKFIQQEDESRLMIDLPKRDPQSDMLYAYRYLLNREPEDQKIVADNTKSWKELRFDFLNSEEFKNSILPSFQVGEIDEFIKSEYEKRIIAKEWEIVDKYHELQFATHDIHCPVCNAQFNTMNSKKYISECKFGGGILERYECPGCGVIFGPLKMFALSEEELAYDYRRHYSLYSEGDTTDYEKYSFYQFNPEKENVYLSYGCGAWSRTICELRDEGYQVWGYEPFANVSDSPYIITSLDQIKTMKFDGIFSNNVLEHLVNPVETFRFFLSLLKDEKSLMIHSTPCYQYLYEYTRFHLFFFTGKSLEIICNQLNLEAFDYKETVIDKEKGPYISYKYRLKK